jgi:hypothetical protein
MIKSTLILPSDEMEMALAEKDSVIATKEQQIEEQNSLIQGVSQSLCKPSN